MTPLQIIQSQDAQEWMDANYDPSYQLVGILNDELACNLHVCVGDCCPIDEEVFFSKAIWDFEGGEYPF